MSTKTDLGDWPKFRWDSRDKPVSVRAALDLRFISLSAGCSWADLTPSEAEAVALALREAAKRVRRYTGEDGSV